MCTNIGICAYMFSYILAHDFDHQRRQCAVISASRDSIFSVPSGEKRRSNPLRQRPSCAV